MILELRNDILNHVLKFYPEFNNYINCPVNERTNMKWPTSYFHKIKKFLRQESVEYSLWFTTLKIFERMYYSQVQNVQLYDTPSSGNVFHSIEITICMALVTLLYDGSKKDPCPRDAHILHMHTWNSLMNTLQEGTYDTYTRELYWASIYGLRTNNSIFQHLISNTSTCFEQHIWATPASRWILDKIVKTTQWPNADVATQ